jgi:hypothetical protein
MRHKIFTLFLILIIFILTTLLVQAQRQPQPADIEDRVWLLEGDRQAMLGDEYFQISPYQHFIVAVAITPEDVTGEVVGAAWTYAIRFGADGLDLPNWERAIEIMMERHPTWEVYTTKGYTLRYDFVSAELDTQDPIITPESTENP